MPALDVQNAAVFATTEVRKLLDQLLVESETIKPIETTGNASSNIEPPLTKADFDDIPGRITQATSGISLRSSIENEDAAQDDLKARRMQIIEIAARDVFGRLISSTAIDSPEFVKVWNYFDILTILADAGLCEPGLLFWLVEELLDSQTIAGCRIIFDWLESRRDRITPESTYNKWSLVLLRICNELLRRLSRAEDNVFCGRVFIFVFQCVSFGDRSSVNLQGAYHVENVTNYETETTADDASRMDVDSSADAKKESEGSKSTTNGDGKKGSPPLSSEALYALFWPLQASFSQPLTLFEPSVMKIFKNSVEETVKKFETIPPTEGPRSQTTQEESNPGRKRKRGDGEDEPEEVETFNPKYLTSKDLFDLEINDLTFRRHILVQTLIILNFILSWTAEAKKRYELIHPANKTVLYSTEFSEDDAKWAKALKTRIAEYMKKDTPGRIFHRMVDTVLSRDKNWVYWKMANCPTIKREPVQPQLYADAKAAAQKLATSKRLRPFPMGAVALDFLQPVDVSNTDENSDKIRHFKRYKLPELDSFKTGIADDDFEIGMPTNDETKARAVAGKASKSWRALRTASRSRLVAFDKIDDPNAIGIVFEEPKDEEDEEEEEEPASEDQMPENRDPIILSYPSGMGKSGLLEKLLESHKGVFAPVVRHTTREPVEGEVDGKDFYFVKAQEFNQLRDGDRLIEYSDADKISYGTSTKTLEAITEKGKIPVIELDIDAAQFAKDMDFTARYVLIKPSSADDLESQLQATGVAESEIKAAVDKFREQLDESKAGELYDTIIVNDDLEKSHQSLVEYLYAAKSGGSAGEDEEMQEEDGKEGEVKGEGDTMEE